MYRGPYLFDFIGAFVRWLFLVLFSQKHRNEKGLFKKILAVDRPLGKEAWEIFFLNFFIGIIAVFLIITAIVYLKYK
jgi:hypothetical protein